MTWPGRPMLRPLPDTADGYARAALRGLRDVLESRRPPSMDPQPGADDESFADDELIDDAATSPELYDGLIRAIGRYCSTGLQLPEPLARFEADVLTGKRVRPVARGNRRVRYFWRDMHLARIVHDLVACYGLAAWTHNELSKASTACGVIEKAASDVGVEISAEKARRAYERHIDEDTGRLRAPPIK